MPGKVKKKKKTGSGFVLVSFTSSMSEKKQSQKHVVTPESIVHSFIHRFNNFKEIEQKSSLLKKKLHMKMNINVGLLFTLKVHS